MGQEREKKILVPNSVPTQPEPEISKKKVKKFKKLKKLISALFLSKTGWGRARKREKKFSPGFRSFSTSARKFQKKKQKKIQKIKKVISGIISIQNGLRETEKERKEI